MICILNTLMEKINVIWLSIDPIRRKIDYYPKIISQKIEKSYTERDIYTNSTCILGSDFFNATINFHTSGICYQTTPGMSMGRARFKQPGYRSVKRIVLNNNDNMITIYSKQVKGEWRLAHNVNDSEIKFEENIPYDNIIESNNKEIPNYQHTYWKKEDFENNNWNLNVVIWQWCRGTTENQGDLLLLDDSWWVPYLYEQNKTIEDNYTNKNNNFYINIPYDNTQRNIILTDSCYGKQIYDDSKNIKVRIIRRKIITLKELKYMLDNINVLPLDPSILTNLLESEKIPNEFYCCISQDIMIDPVKTIDNHTYDRKSIERWFENHSISPLTGLHLSNKSLTSNIELKKLIEDFTRLQLQLQLQTQTQTHTQE